MIQDVSLYLPIPSTAFSELSKRTATIHSMLTPSKSRLPKFWVTVPPLTPLYFSFLIFFTKRNNNPTSSLFSCKQSLTIISSTDLTPIKNKDCKHKAVQGSVIHVLNPSTLGQGVGGSELRTAWSTAFWDSQGYREKTPSQKSKRWEEGKKEAGPTMVSEAFNLSTRSWSKADWVQRSAWSTQ